jgi:hypothetical protein
MTDWAKQSTTALTAANARRVEREMGSAPPRPGLYAVHAPAKVWQELGLGKPPDGRPLYVGKAESSLAGRDLGTHFGFAGDGRATSVTGGSTLRRSIAAILHDSYGYRGVPRNRSNPSHFSNYGLTPARDRELSAWMRERLLLACWAKPSTCGEPLATIEQAVFGRMLPPLNLASVVTPWKPTVDAARRLMAAEARAWRPSRTAR